MRCRKPARTSPRNSRCRAPTRMRWRSARNSAQAPILGLASAAVPPRIMGIGPVPATRKLMERLGIKISDFDLIELNEAFASQGIACLRQLGVKDDADFVNPHG